MPPHTATLGSDAAWRSVFDRDIDCRVRRPWYLVLALSPLLSSCGGSTPTPPPAEPAAMPPAAQPTTSETPVPLAAEDVLFGLQSQLTAMRGCLTEPGAVQLQWEVDKRGSAEAFSTLWATSEQPSGVECLTKLIEGRSFELPKGATRGLATWTFVRDLPLDERMGTKRKASKRPKRANRNQGVKFDPPGSLDSDAVDGVVQGGMKLYAHCLRAGVEAKSSISGRLALSWKVDDAGHATEMADAGSDLGDQQVVDCAAECFYALDYPRPKAAPVRITYSLLFNEE